jgi:7-cyano-7-deazaguanine synthase
MKKAIVLLSGGQDSTTCLAWAKQRFDCLAVSLDYGQRHATELEAAAKIAQHFGVRHIIEYIPVLQSIGGSALVDGAAALQLDGGYADKEAPGGLPTSFVPGRNLLFLAIAGAVAVKHGARHIVTGVCQTDYSGYPDCRVEFIDAMQVVLNAAMPSGCGPFEIHTPLMLLTKAETVKLARSLPGAWEALALSITCYQGKHGGCGECGACDLRSKGFAAAGAGADPACASV